MAAGNSIEGNLIADSPTGIEFMGTDSFFSNNRVFDATSSQEYVNSGGQTDGGGNLSAP